MNNFVYSKHTFIFAMTILCFIFNLATLDPNEVLTTQLQSKVRCMRWRFYRMIFPGRS